MKVFILLLACFILFNCTEIVEVEKQIVVEIEVEKEIEVIVNDTIETIKYVEIEKGLDYSEKIKGTWIHVCVMHKGVKVDTWDDTIMDFKDSVFTRNYTISEYTCNNDTIAIIKKGVVCSKYAIVSYEENSYTGFNEFKDTMVLKSDGIDDFIFLKRY